MVLEERGRDDSQTAAECCRSEELPARLHGAFKEAGLNYQSDIVIINVVGNDLSLPAFIHTNPSPFALNHSFLLNLREKRYNRWC